MLVGGPYHELYIPGVIRLGPTGSLEYLSEALGPAAYSELPACDGAIFRTHPDAPTERAPWPPIGCWMFDGRTHESMSSPNRQAMHHEHDHSLPQSTSSKEVTL